MGAKTLSVLCMLTITMSCEKFSNSRYLDQWEGTYEGTYMHWYINGIDHEQKFGEVLVDVRKGGLDSSLNIALTFNGTSTIIDNDKIFSSQGYHFSETGEASSYYSLTIRFDSDSLHYRSYDKCGIPCTMITEFSIRKN